MEANMDNFTNALMPSSRIPYIPTSLRLPKGPLPASSINDQVNQTISNPKDLVDLMGKCTLDQVSAIFTLEDIENFMQLADISIAEQTSQLNTLGRLTWFNFGARRRCEKKIKRQLEIKEWCCEMRDNMLAKKDLDALKGQIAMKTRGEEDKC